MTAEVEYRWRCQLTDHDLWVLTESHGGRAEHGWWDRVSRHSLGWVSAHLPDHTLIGFVNVAWDGADHAFLLDPKVRPDHQRRGIATELVGRAARAAREAGCEWLHVDFDDHLRDFYLGACGFRPTSAGLIALQGDIPGASPTNSPCSFVTVSIQPANRERSTWKPGTAAAHCDV